MDMKEIKLTQGKVTLVDDEDFEWLSQWKWCIGNDGYAVRAIRLNGKQKTLFMHRVVMNTPSGMDTDHKDRNKLNNQRSNLRVCTRSQNLMNSKKRVNGHSKFKGVHVWTDGKSKYYKAQIHVGGKRIAKCFPFTPEGEIHAAKAYNELAKKHFGEFACLKLSG